MAARAAFEDQMLRWLGLAVVVLAMMLAACGRHVLIRFRTAGPLDFTDVQYLSVFNTPALLLRATASSRTASQPT
jgi:hypothetical protein